MSLQSAAASCVRTVGGCMAIVALALVAFLSLPETLLYNDFVAGAILGGTILLVTGVVRLANPDRGLPAGPDR